MSKKSVSERGDKTYLINELKLTYQYILSYIYNTFIVRHKNGEFISKTSIKPTCATVRNAKYLYGRRSYKRGLQTGLYP